jgi:hypothetical protein
VSIAHACPASKGQTEHNPHCNSTPCVIITNDARGLHEDLHVLSKHSFVPKTKANGVKHTRPDKKGTRLGRHTINAAINVKEWLTAKLSLTSEQIPTTRDTTHPCPALHRKTSTVPDRVSHLPWTAKDTRQKTPTRRTQRLYGVLDGAIDRDVANDRLRKSLKEDGHHNFWRYTIPPGSDDDKPTDMIG